MLEVLAIVLGLAVFDCINPSAILVTIYLLLSGNPRSIPVYVTSIFFTYLAIGVILMFGFGAILSAVGDQLNSSAAYAIQGIIGIALAAQSLVYFATFYGLF